MEKRRRFGGRYLGLYSIALPGFLVDARRRHLCWENVALGLGLARHCSSCSISRTSVDFMRSWNLIRA